MAARHSITAQFVNLSEGHYGNSKGGAIEIASGLSSGQQAKSLAHEIVHERLHWAQNGQLDVTISREVRELEAEAVAYVVCRHFGLDVELRASRYIAHWGGDTKKLANSFARVSQTARELIDEVESAGLTLPATQSHENRTSEPCSVAVIEPQLCRQRASVFLGYHSLWPQ